TRPRHARCTCAASCRVRAPCAAIQQGERTSMPTLLRELRRGTLVPIRRLIDRVDDQLLWWMAGRRRLVAAAARIKQDSGTPMRDPAREAEVHARAQRLGGLLGLPAASVDRLIDLLIE